MKKIQIVLELNEKAVKKIEDLTYTNFKELLQEEINNNTAEFIERLGYDNF
jgi:hypothetical protein